MTLEDQIVDSIRRVLQAPQNYIYMDVVFSGRDLMLFRDKEKARLTRPTQDQYYHFECSDPDQGHGLSKRKYRIFYDPKQPDGVLKLSHPVLGTKEVGIPLLGVVPWVGAPSTRNKPRHSSRSFKGRKCGTLVRETST